MDATSEKKKAPKGEVKFGKIKRVDPEKEKERKRKERKRKRDAKTRKQMRTA
jgi:hypothetical protein